jgi:hypothetical protein
MYVHRRTQLQYVKQRTKLLRVADISLERSMLIIGRDFGTTFYATRIRVTSVLTGDANLTAYTTKCKEILIYS